MLANKRKATSVKVKASQKIAQKRQKIHMFLLSLQRLVERKEK